MRPGEGDAWDPSRIRPLPPGIGRGAWPWAIPAPAGAAAGDIDGYAQAGRSCIRGTLRIPGIPGAFKICSLGG